MRNWTMAVIPLVMAMTATACNGADNPAGKRTADKPADAGPMAIREFALSGFSMVDAAGPDDVTIRQGRDFSVVARGAQTELDKLELRLDGPTLEIGRKREKMQFGNRSDGQVQIVITMPRLEKLRLTGSGDVVADSVQGDAAVVALTGSGNLKLARMDGRNAKIAIAGSGNVTVGGGDIGTGEISITGSGNVGAEALKAATLNISVMGSGDVDASASRTANIRIFGSGNVVLSGGAACTRKLLGSGTLSCS